MGKGEGAEAYYLSEYGNSGAPSQSSLGMETWEAWEPGNFDALERPKSYDASLQVIW